MNHVCEPGSRVHHFILITFLRIKNVMEKISRNDFCLANGFISIGFFLLRYYHVSLFTFSSNVSVLLAGSIFSGVFNINVPSELSGCYLCSMSFVTSSSDERYFTKYDKVNPHNMHYWSFYKARWIR